jgi:hypothetical protein
LTVRSAQQVRAALLSRRELALLDVRPEHEHAQGHPWSIHPYQQGLPARLTVGIARSLR